MRDPYIILGVSRTAGAQEIKAAWRAAAKIYHPDQNPGDPNAASRFTEIGRAYDLLRDPVQRRRYDEAQARAAASMAASSAMAGGAARGGKEPTFMERRAEKARMEAEARAAEARAAAAAAAAAAAMHPDGGEAEIQQAEDVVARIFGTRKSASAQAGASQASSQASASHSYSAAQSAAAQSYAAAAGRSDMFTAPREETQPEIAPADGNSESRPSPALDLLSYLVKRLTRQVPAPDKAPDLAIDAPISVEELYGRVNPTIALPDGKLVSVPLPADACDGSLVRIEGQGHRLPNMKRGDVVARLKVRPHKWYRLDGHDLIVKHEIDIENAVLGCQTVVETPKGQVRVDVPEWSGSNRTVRVEGMGLPAAHGRSGDLIVDLRVLLWDHPDQKVIDLMRSLREGLYL